MGTSLGSGNAMRLECLRMRDSNTNLLALLERIRETFRGLMIAFVSSHSLVQGLILLAVFVLILMLLGQFGLDMSTVRSGTYGVHQEASSKR